MRTSDCRPIAHPKKPSMVASPTPDSSSRFGTPYPGDEVVFGDWQNRPKPDNYGDAIGAGS